MKQLIVDAALRSKLCDLNQPLELCDETGMVLAQVIPTPPGWERVEPPPLSDEEVERIMQEPGYTTAEVLAYLESL